jgi:hypothetical protein
MTENRIKRNGNYLEDASKVQNQEEIDGEEDQNPLAQKSLALLLSSLTTKDRYHSIIVNFSIF